MTFVVPNQQNNKRKENVCEDNASMEQFFIDKSTTTNLDKQWRDYIREFELIIQALGITDGKQKLALLLNLSGKDLREIY